MWELILYITAKSIYLVVKTDTNTDTYSLNHQEKYIWPFEVGLRSFAFRNF